MANKTPENKAFLVLDYSGAHLRGIGIVQAKLTFHPFTTQHFVALVTFSNLGSFTSPMERIQPSGRQQ